MVRFYRTLCFTFVVMAVALAGCSGGRPGSVDDETATSVGIDLSIGRTALIKQVRYTVTGPNGFNLSGSFDVSKAREALGTIPGVPAGAPYTVSLTATSTDGNVTCTGSKSGIVVTCPGNRTQDEKNIRLTCTRNRLGREWGDKDWRSNARTFFLGAELHLLCPRDAGVDAAIDADAAMDAALDVRDAAPEARDAAPESCTPLTACPIGANCGSLPDGCGGVVNCGGCPAGIPCLSNNTCECRGRTTCPAGQTCGTAPDGCGGIIACGTCQAGQTCGTDHTCHSLSTSACDIFGSTTACLQSLDRPGPAQCSTCLADSGCLDPQQGGGTCETVAGTQTHWSGLLPDGLSCPSVFATTAETEKQICLQTLSSIIVSQCAQSGQEVPCLCGTTDAARCLTGSATPTGPLYDLFACDFNSTGAPGIQNTFTTESYGAGMANSIVQCANAFGCDCFLCRPATACPAGINCGSASDGCGGTINCGTCAAPATCGGGGVAGQCGQPCVPLTTCPAGQTCGPVSDGCSGTINCGVCDVGQSCGSDHACHPTPTACTIHGSTLGCLATRDQPGQPSCSQCAIDNGCLDPAQAGGTCEQVAGTLPHLMGPLPDGQSCTNVFDVSAETEAQICLQTLGRIFGSECAATQQETPCLCGNTDAAQCLGGLVIPQGPLYDLYACDFNSTNMNTIITDFGVPTFGVAVANVLVQCVAAYGCNCL